MNITTITTKSVKLSRAELNDLIVTHVGLPGGQVDFIVTTDHEGDPSVMGATIKLTCNNGDNHGC